MPFLRPKLKLKLKLRRKKKEQSTPKKTKGATEDAKSVSVSSQTTAPITDSVSQKILLDEISPPLSLRQRTCSTSKCSLFDLEGIDKYTTIQEHFKVPDIKRLRDSPSLFSEGDDDHDHDDGSDDDDDDDSKEGGLQSILRGSIAFDVDDKSVVSSLSGIGTFSVDSTIDLGPRQRGLCQCIGSIDEYDYEEDDLTEVEKKSLSFNFRGYL